MLAIYKKELRAYFNSIVGWLFLAFFFAFIGIEHWKVLAMLWAVIPLCAALTLLAVPLCDAAEKMLAVKADPRIPADEWMLFPIAVIGIPLMELPWWSMAGFFTLWRMKGSAVLAKASGSIARR
mgnify:CR=1 FL=1